jgi:hypothetical protein
MEQHINEPTGWWGESRRIRVLPAQISTAAHGGRQSIQFISSSHPRRGASVPNADPGSALGSHADEEGANSTRRRKCFLSAAVLPLCRSSLGCGARRLRAVCQGGARCCHVSRRSTGGSVLPGERRAGGCVAIPAIGGSLRWNRGDKPINQSTGGARREEKRFVGPHVRTAVDCECECDTLSLTYRCRSRLYLLCTDSPLRWLPRRSRGRLVFVHARRTQEHEEQTPSRGGALQRELEHARGTADRQVARRFL